MADLAKPHPYLCPCSACRTETLLEHVTELEDLVRKNSHLFAIRISKELLAKVEAIRKAVAHG